MAFTNVNISRSYTLTLAASSLTKLADQECSLVTIINTTGGTVYLYDGNYNAATDAFPILNGQSFVMHGISNTTQVSAIASTAGKISYRTQLFTGYTLNS